MLKTILCETNKWQIIYKYDLWIYIIKAQKYKCGQRLQINYSHLDIDTKFPRKAFSKQFPQWNLSTCCHTLFYFILVVIMSETVYRCVSNCCQTKLRMHINMKVNSGYKIIIWAFRNTKIFLTCSSSCIPAVLNSNKKTYQGCTGSDQKV